MNYGKGGSNFILHNCWKDEIYHVLSSCHFMNYIMQYGTSVFSCAYIAVLLMSLVTLIVLLGHKASATVQPYLLLHLDIYPEAVCTIEDALKLFSAPETLEGYKTSETGKVSYFSCSICGPDFAICTIHICTFFSAFFMRFWDIFLILSL